MAMAMAMADQQKRMQSTLGSGELGGGGWRLQGLAGPGQQSSWALFSSAWLDKWRQGFYGSVCFCIAVIFELRNLNGELKLSRTMEGTTAWFSELL